MPTDFPGPPQGINLRMSLKVTPEHRIEIEYRHAQPLCFGFCELADDFILGFILFQDVTNRENDPHWRGADSRALLDTVVGMVHDRGLEVANADLTVVAQAPRIQPYVETMNCRIAESLQVDPSQVNVKATTTERLGFTGRGEGISAYAVVLLLAR